MICYVEPTDSIFHSSMQTLVCPVNCRGTMGKGLALQFKSRFAGLFESYVNDILDKRLCIGRPTIWKGPEKWVVNFPTKDEWRKPSRYEYIERGLEGLVANLDGWGVLSIALPALGCGLGSLEWEKVKTMIERQLGKLDLTVEVYEPGRESR